MILRHSPSQKSEIFAGPLREGAKAVFLCQTIIYTFSHPAREACRRRDQDSQIIPVNLRKLL